MRSEGPILTRCRSDDTHESDILRRHRINHRQPTPILPIPSHSIPHTPLHVSLVILVTCQVVKRIDQGSLGERKGHRGEERDEEDPAERREAGGLVLLQGEEGGRLGRFGWGGGGGGWVGGGGGGEWGEMVRLDMVRVPTGRYRTGLSI